MGICIDEIISIKLSSKKTKQYYLSLGYDINHEYLDICVGDLKSTSKLKIKCICDHCNNIFFRQRCKIQDIEYIVCSDCKQYKIIRTNLKKYGVENVSQVKEIREKIKKTNVKKYGCESFTASDIFKEQRINTNLKKYKVKYYVESDEFKKKNKETLQNKYGVSSNFKIQSVIDDRENTWFKNYGVSHSWKSDEIKYKIKQTNLNKYGYPNAMSSNEIKQKVINTNLKKYNCKYSLQNPEVRKKIHVTMIKRYECPNVYCKIPCSKQQFYIGTLLNGIINKYIKNYGYADILLEDEMLVIEYDGGGHRLGVKFGSITNDAFDKKEQEKEKSLNKMGYKLIRIISLYDLLPSDNELLLLINEAKQLLNNSNIIKLNIDNNELIIDNIIKKKITLNTLKNIK